MAFQKVTLRGITLLMVLLCEPSFCWRWKTLDATIQEVWPENESLKIKRASASNSPSTQKQPGRQKPVFQDDDDSLVFEGHVFKSKDLPPPPAFMVENAWRGSTLQPTEKPMLLNNLPRVYISSGRLPPASAPASHKFTADNAKGYAKDSKKSYSEDPVAEISSSDSEHHHVSSYPVMTLEDLHNAVEQAEQLEQDDLRDAPHCFTPTDTPGRCLPFKECFPVVFNVVDGDLRNPGLAKLLYQASGPCNASLELDFALRKTTNEKKFLTAEFYNQTICCPGFKHPPALLATYTNDIRNTRLSNDPISSTTESTSTTGKSTSTSTESVSPKSSLSKGKKPIAAEESSVELEIDVSSSTVDDDVDDDDDDEIEDSDAVIIETTDIKQENTTKGNKNEDEDVSKEVRRGDRDKVKESGVTLQLKSKPAPFSLPTYPNSGFKCRNQVFGMPRGHWPWMVALLISSRHVCSGALLDEKHVLTGAHCVDSLNQSEVRKLRIIIGDRVMYSSVDGPHFWRKVNKIITHSNYNQRTFASDIAIIKMNSPVPFSRNVQPINLPNTDSTTLYNSLSKAIVAGWSGADIGQHSFEARTEVETVVDFLDKRECRDVYRGFALSGVAQNTFCTKPANNTCVVDSGGPLVARVHNCWQLLGIMSWGLGCSHFPEVYTDVTAYTFWIRKHTNIP